MTTVVISDNTTGRDYTGSTDTQLAESTPTTNNGPNAWIGIGTFEPGDYNNSIIKFNGISNIPSTATVTSVTMELYQNVTDSSWNVDVHLMLRNWVENQATWNIYSTGNSWATAGGTGTGDITASASATVTVANTNEQYYSFSSAQMAADVQDWVDGSQANYGWLIKPNGTTTGRGKEFASSEGIDGQRPKLTVVYTEGYSPSIAWITA